jgi:hypothetical protein
MGYHKIENHVIAEFLEEKVAAGLASDREEQLYEEYNWRGIKVFAEPEYKKIVSSLKRQWK